MVDLATAFVSVVPSLKGAQKQITSQLSGIDMSGAGSEIGKQLSGSIGRGFDLKTIGARFKDLGGKITGVGQSLTNKITKPAALAATAVGGIVAAFGFKRLVGLDTAQAKLKGLGYTAKDVENISNDVADALVGGMMTLGEGVDVAAGAMAAGVKQGKELQRHIKLVDAAAVGMNTSVDETNQIFNRILNSTGSWQEELRMIEYRMPGFSNAFAEHMGVSYDEMMKLVSEGKVGFDEFSAAMEHFAGDMATEYAKSWEGMWSNTKAYVGMIGESLLEGVFQDGKEELAGFIEMLSSDEVQQWAKDAGEKLREAFETVRSKIRELIDAWNDLDDETKDWIVKLGLVAVAAGPVLTIVGKLVTGLGGLATALGSVSTLLGKGGIAGALGRIVLPVGLAVIAFKYLYDNSEELQDAVARLWDTLKEAWEKIWPSLKPVLEKMGELFEALVPILADLAVEFIDNLLPKIEQFAEDAIPVLEKVADALGFMTNALDTDQWDDDWSWVKKTAKTAGNEIQEGLSLMTMAMKGDWRGLMNKIQEDANEKLPKVQARLSRWGDNIKNITGRATDWIKNKWSTGWNNIASISSNIFGRIGDSARQKFNSLVEFMRGIPGRIKGVFASAGTWLASAGRAIIDGLVAGIRGAFDRVKSTLNELTSFLPSWKGPPSTDRVILRGAGQMVIQGFVDGLESQYQNARRSLGGFTDSLAGVGTVGGGVALAGGGRAATVDDLERLADRIAYQMEIRASGAGVAAFNGARDYSDESISGEAVVRR